jgi:hypothetical protein
LCGGGHTCVEKAPQGWNGPIAAYVGNPANAPSCGSTYPMPQYSGSAQLVAPPAQCSACACNAPTGVACSAAATVKMLPALDCAAQPCDTKTLSLPAGHCVGYAWTCGTINAVHDVSVSNTGACVPSAPKPTVSLPGLTWNLKGVTCAPATLGSGCGSGKTCVPWPPPPPLAEKACILRDGDLGCPAGPYSQKTVLFGNATDQRDCDNCSCAPAQADCSGTVTNWVGDSGTCTSAIQTMSWGVPKTNCTPNGSAYFNFGIRYDAMPKNAACPSKGGQPKGSAYPTLPTTLCCTP